MITALAVFAFSAGDAFAVDPTFSAGPGSPLASSGGLDVATGDFNGDGIADVADVGGSSSVSFLLGTNGQGAFGTKTDRAVGTQATAIAAGDLNRDGKTDVVTVSGASFDSFVSGSATFSTLLGTSTGLGTATNITLPAGRIQDIAVGDVNGDGKPDVVLTSAANLLVYPGNGAGGYGAVQTLATGCPTTSGNGVGSVAIGDVNGDSKTDLVGGCTDGSAVVFLGTGDGAFAPAANALTSGSLGVFPYHLELADMTGDGVPDLLAPDAGSNALAVLIGDGHGQFTQSAVSPGSPFKLKGTSNGVRSVAAADFNGDGKLDTAGANVAGTTGNVATGDGSGGLGPVTGSNPNQVVGNTVPAASSGNGGVAVADFNGDGRPDLAVDGFGTGGEIHILLNSTPTPAVRTGAATNVTETSALLNGIVNPSNLPTTYHFEFGPTSAYGSHTEEFPSGGGSISGTSDQPVTAPLTGLTPGALYHFRLVATNSDGTTVGRDMTFKAGTAPPVNAVLPRITGTATVGRTVTCQRGSWSGNPTFKLRWLINGNPVAGRTSSTFKLPGSAGLKALQCEVTATNAGGSVTKQSKPVAVLPITCKVPDVVSLKLAKAKSKIKKAGCKVGKISKLNLGKSLKGKVLDQDIPAGTKVAGGTKIKLTVGK